MADAQLRLSTYADPVRAVVSVWTDGDPRAVTDVLQRRATQLAGWLVEEREPLPPPEQDGARADASGTFAVLLSDYGMTRPSLFGTTVNDRVDLSVALSGLFAP